MIKNTTFKINCYKITFTYHG